MDQILNLDYLFLFENFLRVALISAFVYLLGSLVVSLINNYERLGKYELLFAKLCGGIFISVACFAILVTTGVTLMWIFLLPIAWVILRNKWRPKYSVELVRDFKEFGVFLFIALGAVAAQCLRFQKQIDIDYHSVWGDYSYYMLVAKQMVISGIESPSYVALINGETEGYMLYHYFDLWTSGFIDWFLGSSGSSDVYSINYVPLGVSILFVGLLAVRQRFNNDTRLVSPIDLIIIVGILPLLLNIHFPKMLGVHLILVAAGLLYMRKKYWLTLVCLLFPPFVFPLSITIYPLAFLAAVSFFFQDKKKELIKFLIVQGAVFLLFCFLVLQYSGSDGSLPVATTIGEDAMQFVVSYFQYWFQARFVFVREFLILAILIIAFKGLIKSSSIAKYAVVYVVLLLSHLLIFLASRSNYENFQVYNHFGYVFLLGFVFVALKYVMLISNSVKQNWVKPTIVACIALLAIPELYNRMVYLLSIHGMNAKYQKEFVDKAREDISGSANNRRVAFYTEYEHLVTTDNDQTIRNLFVGARPHYNSFVFLLDPINLNNTNIVSCFLPNQLNESYFSPSIGFWKETDVFKNGPTNSFEYLMKNNITNVFTHTRDILPKQISEVVEYSYDDPHSSIRYYKLKF